MTEKGDKKLKTDKIVIYKPRKGGVELRVKVEEQTLWLDAHQMARVFGVNRPAVVKHIGNIYKTGELERESTCSFWNKLLETEKPEK